ncbi:hypothetical protein FW320_05550 [Azospirillum sp. Vi22]|uniref:hypothetical protein n=1 Tax=Azospirillum baldaniorum TaxID=1064539 RepID=UPI00157B3392|nr:hypothetical protein [Azospirillum baldaniorum]NUB05643.1 hypothetical protein [Azospirillum baldaniorum]
MTMDLWATLGRVGNQITDTATQFGLQEQKRQYVTFLGNTEVDARTKLLELQDKHRENPDSFRAEWDAYRKGVIKGSPAPYAQQIDLMLRDEGNRGLGVVLNARHAKDEKLADQAIAARLEMGEADVLTAAASGDDERFVTALGTYRAIIEAGASSGLLAPERGALLYSNLEGRARQELVTNAVRGTFWSDGADAARGLLDHVVVPYAAKVIGAEWSPTGPDKNPNSTAAGPGQFRNSTWVSTLRKHAPDLAAGKTDEQVLALRDSGTPQERRALHVRMVDGYGNANETFLKANGVEKVGDAEKYLAHFAGPAGALAVLQADPNTPVRKLLGADAIAANANMRRGGKGFADWTAGDLRAWANGKMDEGATPPGQDYGLTPEMRDRLRKGMTGLIRDLEQQASGVVLQWAAGEDPLSAYGMLMSGQADPKASEAYRLLSGEGKMTLRKELLSAASGAAGLADREERLDEKRRTSSSNRALYELASLDPAAPDYLARRSELIGQVRALGVVNPEAFAKLNEQSRNAGPDNPELLFVLEGQIERGVISNGEALTTFMGRGLSYDTGRRLLDKLNRVGDDRYKTGLARIRAAAGLVEGGLFQANSAEAKAASRMRIAFDDAVDTARQAGTPFDPVEVAKRVIDGDRAQQQTRDASPLVQQYRAELKAAADKVRAAGLRDGQGNVIALEFNSTDDIEAARRLSDPKSGVFGVFKRDLFNERELTQLRTAIQQVHGD